MKRLHMASGGVLNKVFEAVLPVFILLSIFTCMSKEVFAGTNPDANGSGGREGVVVSAHSGGQEKDEDRAQRLKLLRDELSGMNDKAVEQYAAKYNDVENHWGKKVVGKLTGLGIIAGMGDGRFDPDARLQADQFLKMTVLAMGYATEQGKEYWAQPYIDIALKEGLITGDEIRDFKKPLLREQMARIIVQAALKNGEDPGEQYEEYLKGRIADFSAISEGEKRYVLNAYRLGLVTGMGADCFGPDRTMTRAEASAVIVRLLDQGERKPASPEPDEVIHMIDSLGNPVEIYPGAVREYFDIEKAMEKALPLAKGYAVLFYSPDTGAVCVDMYESYEAWYENCIENIVAAFKSKNVYEDSDNSFAFILYVWQKDIYRDLFVDYIKEILKALFDIDFDKATRLHDKYLEIKTDKPGGGNYWETQYINNRYTDFIGGADGFSIRIRLKRR